VLRRVSPTPSNDSPSRLSIEPPPNWGRQVGVGSGALSIMMVSGWHDVLPEQHQRKLAWIVIALMFMLTIALWIFGIVPVYFQPFLD
jgi:hypothetical protein